MGVAELRSSLVERSEKRGAECSQTNQGMNTETETWGIGGKGLV